MKADEQRSKICFGAREMKSKFEKRPFNSEDEVSQIGLSGSNPNEEGETQCRRLTFCIN